MAWYYGTFACGHEGRVNIIGPHKDREWKKERAFSNYCYECRQKERFRPLSGSYISQYHPRNPMSCLGRIGGLRGKSNFIEIQPFWKVKSSHKSSI